MKIAFLFVLVIHGAIHLLGFAKAQFPERVLQITRPVGKVAGWLWLLAAALWMASAAMMFVAPKCFGALTLLAIALSQGLIVHWWADARFGTVVNLLALVPAVVSLLDSRSTSFQARYCRDSTAALGSNTPTRVVGITELTGLPVPLRNYLMRTGVAGRPHVRNFRVHFKAQMRRSLDAGWMDAEADQVESYPDMSRLFLMRASIWGVPFVGYHRFVGDSATMQVRVLSLFDVVDASGKLMTASETVTLFNDMCILAPASLLDARIEWRQTDDSTVHGVWTHDGNTVAADLFFDAAGDLVNFVSFDRYLSSDGKTYQKYPWATPVRNYRDVGGRRVPGYAEAVWRLPSGNFTYARFEVDSIEYNVAGSTGSICR